MKDQEINEADKILENVNDTKNIEKESTTGDVISEKDYNKTTINATKIANDEATIETKDTTQVIKNATPEKVIVKEVVEEPTPVVTKTVVEEPTPVVTKTIVKK